MFTPLGWTETNTPILPQITDLRTRLGERIAAIR